MSENISNVEVSSERISPSARSSSNEVSNSSPTSITKKIKQTKHNIRTKTLKKKRKHRHQQWNNRKQDSIPQVSLSRQSSEQQNDDTRIDNIQKKSLTSNASENVHSQSSSHQESINSPTSIKDTFFKSFSPKMGEMKKKHTQPSEKKKTKTTSRHVSRLSTNLPSSSSSTERESVIVEDKVPVIKTNKKKTSARKRSHTQVTRKSASVRESTKQLLNMNKKELISLLKNKLKNGTIDATKVFKFIHYKHGGLNESDISPKWMRKLLKYTLQRELPIDNSPRTLIAVLQTMHKRKLPKMQVDCLIRKGGLFGHSTESIPYTIAKSNVAVSRKIKWLKGITNDVEIGYLFDLNRRVGNGGNLLVNSFTKLHNGDIQWYSFLLEEMHLAVNSKQDGKTLKDFVLKDLNANGSSPRNISAPLFELLDAHGGKTRVELRH